MKFHQPTADLFVPDGAPAAAAFSRVTHLGIGAHQDDLEFMALHGIAACYRRDDAWFGGVTCTDGAGSSRTGRYARCSDLEMRAIRHNEQRHAAVLGQYGVMVQLGYPSKALCEPGGTGGTHLREDLTAILRATRPCIVYTHNPADKHETHIAVTVAVLQAIRGLPPDERPSAVHGCEVWRDLDWLPDAEKIVHDLDGHDELAAALNAVFNSQIGGGKRYDLGVMGRRRANATFFQSHASDRSGALAFAMDLTPLVQDDTLDVAVYVAGFIDRFRAGVVEKLQRYLAP